jgi:hypothetical protein
MFMIIKRILLPLSGNNSVNRKGHKGLKPKDAKEKSETILCVLCAFFVYFAVKRDFKLIKLRSTGCVLLSKIPNPL